MNPNAYWGTQPMNNTSAYGQWLQVLVNSLVLLLFVFSFYQPRTKRDWRTFGGFAAFIVALFTEMYGFPLTIFLLSGWLTSRYPGVNFLSHDAGHLWEPLLGLKGDPHFGLPHLLSNVLILGGLFLLVASWKVLYRAQRSGELAVTGPYSRIRHPQYAAFMVIMAGFLVQWPTLPTLIMFPILVWMYVRLARREEGEVRAEFGERYDRYAERTPRFVPRIGKATSSWGTPGISEQHGGLEP
jgi:protein-S-isoprenylcysteine O-methyltransferase Ste14